LTPGFLSDVVGFFFVLPVTRPLARRGLTRFLTRRFLSGPVMPDYIGRQPGATASGQEGPRTQQRPGPDAVVQGEVVD
jgi:UPF0716 protein FxsA